MLGYFSLRYPVVHSNVSIERFRVKSDAKWRGTNCWTLSSFEQIFQYISMVLWVRTLFMIWQNNNNDDSSNDDDDDDDDEDNNNNYYYYKNNDDIINNNVKVKAQLAWSYVTPSR